MLPILVFTKPATTLFTSMLEVKMPMLAKPARTHVMATTGTSPALTAVPTPRPKRGRIAA